MKRIIKPVLIALFWLAVWALACTAVKSEILLPSPQSTLKALWSLLKTADFYKSAAFSVLRILAGFISGAALGILLGSLTAVSSVLRSLFSPVMSIIKATPVASFIVLLFVWFSNGAVASFTSGLIVLPVMWSSTFTSVTQIDKELVEMAALFKVPFKKMLSGLYIPSVLPQLKSAAATALGLAWKAGIAAEVICSPKNSIGSGIYSSKIYLDTPSLFAWTLTVIVISVLLEKLIIKLLSIKKAPRKEAVENEA